jgi:transposase
VVEIMYERVAAIDVGKKIVAVAVRRPGARAGERRQEVRKFSTYYRTLTAMVAWLVCEGVTHVTMEATDVIRGSNKFLPRFSRLWPSRTRP